jgi:hypothetical protein
LVSFLKIQSCLFFKENKNMKVFESHTFKVQANTSRLDFLGEIKKFGIFSGVEFECRDAGKGIFFVREVGVLERLAKMVHGILSKDVYRASGDALLHLAQKNMVLAGILGRSVFEVREKPLSARELGNKLKVEEKKFDLEGNSVLAVPSEGKLIVTDALSLDFGEVIQVDLTEALTDENFLNACNFAFSKAIGQSSKEAFIVKIGSASDDDEISDEGINKLFLAIDVHQQSNPTSRIMIATDDDRVLYERLLNLKIQHDAKKVLQKNEPDLSAYDLLFIPENGVEVEKIKSLNEDSLSKIKTQFEGVFICKSNSPHLIQSDLSITAINTLLGVPAGFSAASDLLTELANHYAPLEIQKVFDEEGLSAENKSTMFSCRLPAMDLPVKRLIVFEHPRASWLKEDDEYDDQVNKVRDFYLELLRGEGGRVVIQYPGKEYACEGLRRAIEELRKLNQGPGEVIVTTGTYPHKSLEGF